MLLLWHHATFLHSFLATTSHDIAPMTLHMCMRHCALTRIFPHIVLSWLRCCCISMLHLSNRPWRYAHDSLSLLAQGIVPLCHCQEMSLRHALCHYGHGLHTTTCPEAHVWVPTRLTPCVLLMLETLHKGPLVLSHLSHHHVSHWVTYPL